MPQATPFLTFQPGRGQSAARGHGHLLLSLFDDGRVLTDQRYGAEGPGAEGTVIWRSSS